MCSIMGAFLQVTVGGNTFSSDDSWKCWATGQTGSSGHNIDPPAEWERTYFDDSGWQNAVMRAGPKDDRWGYGLDDSCNGCNNIWQFVHSGAPQAGGQECFTVSNRAVAALAAGFGGDGDRGISPNLGSIPDRGRATKLVRSHGRARAAPSYVIH